MALTKPTQNTGWKVLACFLLILSIFAAAGSGIGTYYGYQHGFYGGPIKPYYESVLCRKTTYAYASGLIDHLNHGAWNSYDKEAFSPKHTNYRYIVKMEDGTVLLKSQMDETAVFIQENHFSLYDSSALANADAAHHTEPIDVIVESYITESPTIADDYWNGYRFHQSIYDIHKTLPLVLLGSLLLFAATFIYLLCAAGHQADKEGITPNLQDKIPLDLYLLAVCSAAAAIGIIFLDGNPFDYMEAIVIGIFGLLTLSILALATILTCVTRIKLGRYFYQNTLLYRLLRLCWKGLKVFCALCRDMLHAIPVVWKVAVVWLVVSFGYLLGGFPAFLLNLLLLFFFCIIAAQMDSLKKGGEQLANGDLEYRVDTRRMFPIFRSHGKNLNSISEGFSIALEQKMKSERMKTDLITNVSHDIKTPLTSIINYVDLLKKEGNGLEGQAAEYIEVLDRQSHRLKKLTEDLLEASKASTGNLHVNSEPTDIGELVTQAVAEYEEKLKAAKLEAIISGGERPVYAMADGSLTWRILSNLLSNACKYSQTNTRVYIDIHPSADSVSISMKNISRDALNIPADELMERFVRGDSARHTEGSGLGLHIAQSLATLQKGRLSLQIDGDLFKAELTLPAAELPQSPIEDSFESEETTSK